MKDLVYIFGASQGHKAFPRKDTNPHNYRFDEIGNLVRDSIEQIDTINWMVTGKIKSIIRKASSAKDNLYFDYDAQGNRIAKHNYTSANVWKHSTYYVRDAQGNVMSVYNKKIVTPGMSYKLDEQHIYGSSRLGMTNPGLEMIGATASIDTVRMYLGFKHYELSNHLGNVLTTISDKKIQIGYTGCPLSLDFNSGNTTGMQTDNALLSTATQSLEVTPLSAFAGVNAVFTSTPGVTYNIQFTFNNNTTNATDGFVITAYDFDGTTYSNITNLQIGLPPNGVNSYVYTAGPSTSFVKFYYTSGLNVPTHSFYIDDLSICSPSSTPTPTVVDHFIADISSSTDYFAGGQMMPGRTYNPNLYRYGHNTQEKDDEIFVGAYTAEYWEYDSRTLRRWNTDPIRKPWESPYATFSGNPIYFSDPNGLDSKDPKEAKSGAKDGAGTKYSSDDNTRTNGNSKQTFDNDCKCYINNDVLAASNSSGGSKTPSTNNTSSTANNKPVISQAAENTVGAVDLGLDLVEKYAPLQRDAGILESGRFKMKVNDIERVMKQGFQGNQSVPSAAVKEAKVAFAAKAATKLKVLSYVEVAGKVANGAGMVMTVVKMANGDKSPKNKYDLVMGGVGFIPGPGWAISGGYFVGSLIVGEDNMNAGIEMSERGVSQGWEAVHTQNQNLDATTHIVCFTKGTLVHTPKGLIKIEEIKSTDNVYSYNLIGDSIVVDTVVNVLNRYTDHIYKIKVGDEIIEATSEHPFYVVGKEWVKAKDLKQGDKLKTSSKSTLTISEINYSVVEVMVYNIEVNKNKNYFVTKSGVLVHTKPPHSLISYY